MQTVTWEWGSHFLKLLLMLSPILARTIETEEESFLSQKTMSSFAVGLSTAQIPAKAFLHLFPHKVEFGYPHKVSKVCPSLRRKDKLFFPHRYLQTMAKMLSQNNYFLIYFPNTHYKNNPDINMHLIPHPWNWTSW